MTEPTYDEREQRTRDYYAAVHTDRLLNSATAVMRKADEEIAALFDSDDPAVHAAMLDALTRHGVLTDKTIGYGATATYTYQLRRYVSDEREVITSGEVTP